MALLDAKEYDPRPAQRRWRLILIAAGVILVPFLVWRFGFYYWPEERVINKFFEAIERKDFEAAYGIYNADPHWKQHPEKYAKYTLAQFQLDWGPSGDYGPITSHRIDCVKEPPTKDFVSPSGVIINVILNNRSQAASLWVEKKNKTVTLSPWELQCHPPR